MMTLLVIVDWIFLILGIILTAFGGLGVFLFSLIEKRIDYIMIIITLIGICLLSFGLTGIVITAR